MKILLLPVLVMLSLFLNAQTQEDIAFDKVSAFLVSHKTPAKPYYNKYTHTLDIDGQGTIVVLRDAKFEYVFESGEHKIRIGCMRDETKKAESPEDEYLINHPEIEGSKFDKDCLSDNGKGIASLTLTGWFTTKEDCYKFINLIAELRNSIKQ
jgi:hypothetical protein